MAELLVELADDVQRRSGLCTAGRVVPHSGAAAA